MADETTAPATQAPAQPAKKIVVKPATVPVITPWAFRESKLRESMIARISNFKPEGNPDSAQLAAIRAHVLADIAALPAEFNGAEVAIEAKVTGSARQTLIIVIGKNF